MSEQCGETVRYESAAGMTLAFYCELPPGHAGLHGVGLNVEDEQGVLWPAALTWSTDRDD